jgi:hypothetical protein
LSPGKKNLTQRRQGAKKTTQGAAHTFNLKLDFSRLPLRLCVSTFIFLPQIFLPDLSMLTRVIGGSRLPILSHERSAAMIFSRPNLERDGIVIVSAR